ncbi:MAG: hypothetical protein GYA24_02365 [Candidatus Lokiarchaeota archaeon]|nr:hypothetical protein [Candidatus Lokiarchaeota archaeon]
MKRFITLDILRGASILGMIFLHLVDDLYDLSWTTTQAGLDNHSIAEIFLLIAGIFFGSWAGLFLLVSATGNMVSMHDALEKGKTVRSVVIKQVVGGFILLLFGFLAEGTLQYYGLFQTVRMGTMDFTRIIWKGFTMETIHTIAWCMIINGFVQGLLSLNHGHSKAKRNMIVYAILAIVVVIATQPIWDWLKTIYPGYPFTSTGYMDRIVQNPGPDAGAGEYILKFFFLPLGGLPEPIFPFLAVSFLGSMIGIAITRKDISRKWPKQGVLLGMLIVVAGFVVWIAADMPFSSLLPLDNFSMFSRIGGGAGWKWLPWICFITGSQVALTSLMFRLIEFRGNARNAAERSKFVRKFGMIPFTLYTFHRTIAMAPLLLLSWIFQVDMTIDVHNLDGWTSLGAIAVCLLFMYGLMLLWERKDYIGSLEWMIGTIGAYALGIPRRSGEKMKWYRWGARDQQKLFYNAEWIDLFPRGDNGGVECRDSKLAMKMGIAALMLPIGLGSAIGISLYKTARTIEGPNKYGTIARGLLVAAIMFNVTLIVALALIKFGALGISL